MKLAARVVRDVNEMRDSDGLTYAQKAMIRCGLSRDLNGQWRIAQLFPHLKNIIEKHRAFFDGKSPFEGDETETDEEVHHSGGNDNN